MTESLPHTYHIHILGIAEHSWAVWRDRKAAGFRVTGSDLNVYPPMSTQLQALGIEFVQGYGAEQLDLKPDMVLWGCVEPRQSGHRSHARSGMAYTSGRCGSPNRCCTTACDCGDRTHGKTPTAMLTWILEEAGLAPGFLVAACRAISNPAPAWEAAVLRHRSG